MNLAIKARYRWGSHLTICSWSVQNIGKKSLYLYWFICSLLSQLLQFQLLLLPSTTSLEVSCVALSSKCMISGFGHEGPISSSLGSRPTKNYPKWSGWKVFVYYPLGCSEVWSSGGALALWYSETDQWFFLGMRPSVLPARGEFTPHRPSHLDVYLPFYVN